MEQAVAVWLVYLVLATVVVEGVGVIAYHRLTGKGLSPGQILPNLAAALCLLLAVRLTLAGSGPMWLAVCLTGAGAAHVLDLYRR